MSAGFQYDFDHTIGRLDRILSEMVFYGKQVKKGKDGMVAGGGLLDLHNIQTLKHHAEDMILAGQKILRDIGYPVMEHHDGILNVQETGTIRHGKGCYQVSEDGGGESYEPLGSTCKVCGNESRVYKD